MKKIVALLILLAAVCAVFYFKTELVSWYFSVTNKLPDIESISINSLVENIEKQISLPPPLFGPRQERESLLTSQGTIKLTNAQRAQNGVLPLLENKELDATAAAKAKDIFQKQYFEHVSPGGVGPADLAKNAGYEYITIGENLALGNFADDEELVQAWMQSPGHRANILNSRFKEIGVAVLLGEFEGKKAWVAVQEFGTPASECPQPNPTLRSQIDFYDSQIKTLSKTIETKKTQIEAMPKRNADEFRRAVGEYNNLVNQHNSLNIQIKSLVESYNSQVRAFNECIK